MKYLIIFLLVFVLSSCASKKHSNISYLEKNKVQHIENETVPTLNVFTPRKKSNNKKPVLIFVHGGNWNSGSKNTYGFLGRNFAKHDIITVIPGYTLSPNANYNTMAQQIAEAITWTKNNIELYGGDASQLYLTGHSAGGHLVTLATLNPKYGIDPTSISGIILNDAAALDMHNYLQNNPPKSSNNYDVTWTTNPENWKDASPIYFLSQKSPTFKIYLGSKTYSSITVANKRFLEELHNYQPNVQLEILDKKHVPMVTQYIWPWSERFDEIKAFMNK